MSFCLSEWIQSISDSVSSALPTGPYYVPVVLYERIGSLYEALHSSTKSFVLLPPYETSLSEWIPKWLSRLPMGDGPESIAGSASKPFLDPGNLSWGEYFWRDPVSMSLLSTFIISIVPLLLLAPLLKFKFFASSSSSESRKDSLLYLLAFAAGGLLGDVFFHLLPETFGSPALFLLSALSHSHGHDHGHGHGHHHYEEEHFLLLCYKQIGLALVIGILLFWIFELCNGQLESCSHVLPSAMALPEESAKAKAKANKRATKRVSKKTLDSATSLGNTDWVHLDDEQESAEEPERPRKRAGRKSKVVAATATGSPVMTPGSPSLSSHVDVHEAQPASSAWLHLLADALHNFTDGLALSAAWIASLSSAPSTGHGHSHGGTLGWSTTLAILFHEVPHELGDIAILMQVGGMSLRSALWAQCFTALGAFAGTLTGLWLGLYASTFWAGSTRLFALILPFTAGGFLYLALSMILPQIKASQSQGASRSTSSLLRTVACFAFGLALMYFVD